MSIQRGLESTRPAQERLFLDPLAARFVSRPWRVALACARIAPLRRTIEALYDRIGGPGPRASAIARTKLIDDAIAQFSPDQLVILGAGYDTRAERLDCLADCAVYEVDHANTQVRKRAILAGASAARTPVYVAVDFERDELAATLIDAGLERTARTTFLWEGVTQYLSADAVDRTLSAICETARSGDTLLFTYVDDAALRGSDDRFPEAAKWLAGTAKRGEPWIFGISPATLADYLRVRGFSLLSDISTREAGERYFRPLSRAERGSALYRVATATID